MANHERERNDKKPELPAAPRANRAALAVFLSLTVLFGAYLLFGDRSSSKEIPYSSFLSYLELGEVKSVRIIDQRDMEGVLRGKGGAEVAFSTRIPYYDDDLMRTLREKNVSVTGEVRGASPLQILIELTPWLFGFMLIWVMMRQMQGNNKAFTFGKSRAKLYSDNGRRITFDDVAGQKEA
ncbi:MAG: ATP-dependent metallopeptidase FtsH/Yme1/Tma family protein, partial [Rectinemataceae bacterium]